MKISKKDLKQIINEEINNIMNEIMAQWERDLYGAAEMPLPPEEKLAQFKEVDYFKTHIGKDGLEAILQIQKTKKNLENLKKHRQEMYKKERAKEGGLQVHVMRDMEVWFKRNVYTMLDDIGPLKNTLQDILKGVKPPHRENIKSAAKKYYDVDIDGKTNFDYKEPGFLGWKQQ